MIHVVPTWCLVWLIAGYVPNWDETKRKVEHFTFSRERKICRVQGSTQVSKARLWAATHTVHYHGKFIDDPTLMEKLYYDISFFQFSFERSRSDKVLGNIGIGRLEHSPSTLDTPHRENIDRKSPGRMYSQVSFVCCSYMVAAAVILEYT